MWQDSCPYPFIYGGSMARDVTTLVKRGLSELTKQFLVYDGNGRLTDCYEAGVDAANGDPCLRTIYQYVTGTTRVEKMREEQAVWSAAYD